MADAVKLGYLPYGLREHLPNNGEYDINAASDFSWSLAKIVEDSQAFYDNGGKEVYSEHPYSDVVIGLTDKDVHDIEHYSNMADFGDYSQLSDCIIKDTEDIFNTQLHNFHASSAVRDPEWSGEDFEKSSSPEWQQQQRSFAIRRLAIATTVKAAMEAGELDLTPQAYESLNDLNRSMYNYDSEIVDSGMLSPTNGALDAGAVCMVTETENMFELQAKAYETKMAFQAKEYEAKMLPSVPRYVPQVVQEFLEKVEKGEPVRLRTMLALDDAGYADLNPGDDENGYPKPVIQNLIDDPRVTATAVDKILKYDEFKNAIHNDMNLILDREVEPGEYAEKFARINSVIEANGSTQTARRLAEQFAQNLDTAQVYYPDMQFNKEDMPEIKKFNENLVSNYGRTLNRPMLEKIHTYDEYVADQVRNRQMAVTEAPAVDTELELPSKDELEMDM